MEESGYRVPLGLTIVSAIFLALGALFSIIVTADIIHRRGWRSMIGIMIPVYIINATYLGPLDLFIYYRFGRPAKPSASETTSKRHACHAKDIQDTRSPVSSMYASDDMEKPAACHMKPEETACPGKSAANTNQNSGTSSSSEATSTPAAQSKKNCCSRITQQTTQEDKPACHVKTEEKHACHTKADSADLEAACHSKASTRPFWATVLVGVSHCGAGCVLGDLVGEWLVYGTGASINGHGIWAELLIDYAFALLFGIFFQYFSIAPMSGEWGPMTLIRAAKADVISLTSFEVGAFAWMIAYQVGIFGYRLSMDTWLYWWMMQIGMCLGVATAFPTNWWLLRKGIKEPCC